MSTTRFELFAACAFAGMLLPARATVDPGPGTVPRTEFAAPLPGSYQLQRIQTTPDAIVLDTSGRARHLARYLRGKITLLTFFYTYCVDPLGCPFAHVTLDSLRSRVLSDPELPSSVRFVNLTLDPTTDTPTVLKAYAGDLASDASFEWRFVTTRSVAELLPLLADFGQDVSVDVDEQGRPTRVLHHMLKVFLIDGSGTVREIYSLAFLQPDVIFNDLKTLAMERASVLGARGTRAQLRFAHP